VSNLITRERALRNLNNLATTANENTALDALIAAASDAIERFCKRTFAAQEYDELYSGTDSDRLLLRHFPIVAVQRVASGPTGVLRIRNSSATNQRASVAVTKDGLTLVTVASGVTSTDTSITWSTSATLSALASAVTALGNGWSGTVIDSAYGSRAAADLRPIQGALAAKDQDAELKLHVTELSNYDVHAEIGTLSAVMSYDGIREQGAGWPGGVQSWRIIYTAGYSAVPESVQEACAEWVAALFWQTKRDPGLTQETIPGIVARSPLLAMPSHVYALLLPYRDQRVHSLGE
jgi:hypothetical protein